MYGVSYKVRMLRDPPNEYLEASMPCQVPCPIVSMLFTYMLHQVVLYESRQSVCAHEQERSLRFSSSWMKPDDRHHDASAQRQS